MEVTFRVRRYQPDSSEPGPYYQEYTLDMDENAVVLDGLLRIREEVDGSLALRCSCRSAICGSCAMRINGYTRLACNTKVVDMLRLRDGPITVEPVGNMAVIKDLVVDQSIHWDKVRAVDPWLQHYGPVPEHEFVAPNEDMLRLAGPMACIMCGACVSECTVLEVDKSFLGPAALAKAYRLATDPRDDAQRARLAKLNEPGGIWDCTRCMQCVEVCPKDVDPMGRIMALRALAIQAGYTNTYGARHAIAFAELVEDSGLLDELRLPIKTFGITNLKEMIKLIPVGIASQMAGKRPPIFHKKIPGVQNVRRIFQKVEGQQE